MGGEVFIAWDFKLVTIGLPVITTYVFALLCAHRLNASYHKIPVSA